MKVAEDSFCAPLPFEERQVLDALGHGLRKIYGEPEAEPLPERLQELIEELKEIIREQQVGSP